MEKEKIKFKPLHEGMGFHPFSDGLPYAPESKNKSATGTGATAAGRPQFANASTTIPTAQTAKATARQIQERQQALPRSQAPIIHSPLHDPLKLRMRAPERKLGPSPAAKVVPAPVMTADASIIRRRVFAYLMDTVIHAGFWLATNLTALFLFKFQLDSDILKDNFGQFFVFFLVSQWMFIALQEILFENSIGKVFFNLEFKRNHRSLFLRSFVFMVGLLTFGMGLYFRPQDRLGEIQLKSKLYGNA